MFTKCDNNVVHHQALIETCTAEAEMADRCKKATPTAHKIHELWHSKGRACRNIL